jgi:hypothetical protein
MPLSICVFVTSFRVSKCKIKKIFQANTKLKNDNLEGEGERERVGGRKRVRERKKIERKVGRYGEREGKRKEERERGEKGA